MPEIVINTGPLIALCAALEDLSALAACYRSILVPKRVVSELSAGTHGLDDIQRLYEAGLFDIAEDEVSLPVYLASSLDAGEASVIASALLFGIPKVAIDEKIGRRIARMHALEVTGSTGILLKCAKAGAIQDLEKCFITMKLKGIWISESIKEHALAEFNRGP